jgi:hypothetical protein
MAADYQQGLRSLPPRRSLVPDNHAAPHVPPAPGQLTGETLAGCHFWRFALATPLTGEPFANQSANLHDTTF